MNASFILPTNWCELLLLLLFELINVIFVLNTDAVVIVFISAGEAVINGTMDEVYVDDNDDDTDTDDDDDNDVDESEEDDDKDDMVEVGRDFVDSKYSISVLLLSMIHDFDFVRFEFWI